MSNTIEQRIEALRIASKKYEHDGSSDLSDQEFDKEYYELQKIAPNHPFFDEVGGALDEGVYGESLPHKISMGSLNKSLTISEFETWLKNNFDPNEKVQFLLQHKIDGLSLSLLYRKGQLVQCLTRGDGQKGISVINNCKYIKDIPQSIPYLDEVEIRGEVFKDKASFQKKWKPLGYANERAFAAGGLNQKDPKVTGERELSFLAYEIVRKDDFKLQQEKILFLEQNGFKNLRSSTKITKEGSDFSKIAKVVETYMGEIDRKNLPYLIDGVVVKLCDISKAKEMGSSSDNRKPKSDRAVKYPPMVAETTLLDIEVKTGRSGKLCPVGILREVEIDGSNISRVTLHNFGMITGKDALKIGAKVKIARKGDIIPQIIEVVKNEGSLFKIPTTCPSCGENVEWTESRVDLVCNNVTCGGQLNNRIEFFLKTIGVEGIGPGIIERLTEPGSSYVVKCLADVYGLSNFKNDLSRDFGSKATENILESISSVSELSLTKFIHGLGISKIGSMAKELVSIAPTISEIDNLKAEDIVKIQGFGDVKAKSFIQGWKSQRSEIEKILKHIKITEVKMDSKILDGKSFCITGTLSKPRNEFQDLIEKNGGKVSSSVSKNLSYLICGEEAGSKMEKAEKLGVRVLSEKEFEAMLKK